MLRYRTQQHGEGEATSAPAPSCLAGTRRGRSSRRKRPVIEEPITAERAHTVRASAPRTRVRCCVQAAASRRQCAEQQTMASPLPCQQQKIIRRLRRARPNPRRTRPWRRCQECVAPRAIRAHRPLRRVWRRRAKPRQLAGPPCRHPHRPRALWSRTAERAMRAAIAPRTRRSRARGCCTPWVPFKHPLRLLSEL